MGEKVQGVIETIRGKVDEIIETIIGKAKTWFDTTKGGRKKDKKGKKGKKGDGEDENAEGETSEEDKEEEDEGDERDDAALQQDFDKGMQKGKKALETPKAKEDELLNAVDGVKQKYRMDERNAVQSTKELVAL